MAESADDIFGMLNFGGRTLMCWRSFPLLFDVCWTYGIYSVPWLVRYTILVTHVVPNMLYPLAYYESIISFLLGLGVCGCNQTLHRYVYMPISGGGWLIVRVNSGLLLLAIALCPTYESVSLYLNFKVSLWSGSSNYVWISLHCCLCEYFGGLTGILYT